MYTYGKIHLFRKTNVLCITLNAGANELFYTGLATYYSYNGEIKVGPNSTKVPSLSRSVNTNILGYFVGSQVFSGARLLAHEGIVQQRALVPIG